LTLPHVSAYEYILSHSGAQCLKDLFLELYIQIVMMEENSVFAVIFKK